ncbi:MFS transporter [Olsenella sp. HMSC062G07]|uniref:MFS transporter n=1 Tax=Olsenella sp. HMSC062G07 TaxID=1739330 RepID=UPI0008A2DFDC|nr:MFS transporter [Olsenella sp. HMSC062G07]OFK24831.1 MFS transporter [Olsenella sp. HMSC062G07]
MTTTKLTRAEKSWIMYDVGNSALVLLATTLIPIYFNQLVKAADPAAQGTALVAWSYGETVASLVIALLMPVLGSIADQQGMKKRFIVGTVGIGVVATVALGFPTLPMAFLVVYVLSSVMLNSSMVFYDALLVDTTSDERMDDVSSQGYAWGYIGSVIPFILCLLVVLMRPFGMELQRAMQITFVITAAWWVAFTIPLLKNVEQRHFKPRMNGSLARAARGVIGTLRDIWANRELRFYIIAYFFYIDGVHTIIKLATSYGANLGIDSTQLLLALLVTQFVAFPSAIAYGKLGGRLGTRTMLLVGIAGYTFITCFAAFFLKSALEFWFLAIMVGLFQGGIQALSRSEFGKLAPKEHANEYFGFFDIFGKYAAIMGTFIVGFMTQLTGNSNLGVFSIVVLFVIGFVMMLKVPAGDASAS